MRLTGKLVSLINFAGCFLLLELHLYTGEFVV
jgi:hypothetical protein